MTGDLTDRAKKFGVSIWTRPEMNEVVFFLQGRTIGRTEYPLEWLDGFETGALLERAGDLKHDHEETTRPRVPDLPPL